MAHPLEYFATAYKLAVENTVFVPVTTQLPKTQMLQVYVPYTATEDDFLVRLPNGTEVEVPAGGDYLLEFDESVGPGQTLLSLKTATIATTFQVLFHRTR